MLTADVRFEGFTIEQWTLLAEVFRAERRVDESVVGDSAAGGLLLVEDSDKSLRKAVHTRRGRLELDDIDSGAELSSIGEGAGAAWALRIDSQALHQLMGRWGSRLIAEMDISDQLAALLDLLRELESEGKLAVWPWSVSSWPVPSARIRARALDALCPDGKVLLLGVFDGGELATSIALRRKGRGFDFLLGPDQVRGDMGLIAGDWTRDYRHLARAVEERMGPIAIGCFGELSTFRTLATRPGPGAWAAAVAAREIIVSPVVPALAIPLGVDVGRAAFGMIRGLAERFGAGGWFGSESPLGPTVERVLHVVEDKDVVGLLGFDPLDLLRKLVSRRSPPEE